MVPWAVQWSSEGIYKQPVKKRGNYPYGCLQRERMLQCVSALIEGADKDAIFHIKLYSPCDINNNDSWNYIKTHITAFIRKIRNIGISKYIIEFKSDLKGFCFANMYVTYPNLIATEYLEKPYYKKRVKEQNKEKICNLMLKFKKLWNGKTIVHITTSSTVLFLFEFMKYDIEESIVRIEEAGYKGENRPNEQELSDRKSILTHYFLDKFNLRQFTPSLKLCSSKLNHEDILNKYYLFSGLYTIIPNEMKYNPNFSPVSGEVIEDSVEWDYYVYLYEEKRELWKRNKKKKKRNSFFE